MAGTMKAITLPAFGDADALVYEDMPRPVAADDELLVEVHAVGINPIDWKTRIGKGVNRRWPDGYDPFPVILGWDVSGVVVETRTPDFAIGDEIYAMSRFPALTGGYAEYVAVPAADAAAKPETVDHVHAAAVPLAALTAWQALIDTARLQAGETVLVTSAAGGVGHFAVQIAKCRGARVIGVASARNEDFVRSIGADDFIDYTTTDIPATVRDLDVVFHMTAPDAREALWQCLKPDGFMVSIAGFMDDEERTRHGRAGAFMGVHTSDAQLVELAALIDQGVIRPEVEATYPLERTADAHRHVERGHTRGKIVVTVKG